MRNVLLITYYFPPLGLGGVQRPAKWVKYLPYSGWDADVVTVKDIVYYAADSTLCEDTSHARVYRTGSLDPLRTARILGGNTSEKRAGNGRMRKRGRFFRRFINYGFIPDVRVTWVPFVLECVRKLCGSGRQYDAVITTSPPNSCHLAGYFIRKLYGIPWVADVRDDWYHEILTRSPTFVHRALNTWIFKIIMRSAHSIVTVSAPIADHIRGVLKSRCPALQTICNGYDEDDFEDAEPEPENKFTIVYTGSLTPYTNPGTFLAGLAQACERDAGLSENILVKMAGACIDVDVDGMVKKYHLEEQVRIYGYRSHRESIGMLRGCDTALLLISEGLGRGMVTGKLFEYMGSGSYILAVAPQCAATEILKEYRHYAVAAPGDTEAVAGHVIELYSMWKRGELKKKSGTGLSKKYSRKHQTAELAALLDRVQHKQYS